MSKKLTKAYESLGNDTVKELEAMEPLDLRRKVVEASESMRKVAEELEDNGKYQSLKSDLKDLSAGKREVDKRQKAIILVALSLLNQ